MMKNEKECAARQPYIDLEFEFLEREISELRGIIESRFQELPGIMCSRLGEVLCEDTPGKESPDDTAKEAVAPEQRLPLMGERLLKSRNNVRSSNRKLIRLLDEVYRVLNRLEIAPVITDGGIDGKSNGDDAEAVAPTVRPHLHGRGYPDNAANGCAEASKCVGRVNPSGSSPGLP